MTALRSLPGKVEQADATPGPAIDRSARLSRFVGAALALAVGLIHLVQAPEYLQGTTYIGVLFILGGVALVAVAASLALNQLTGPGWLAGLAVCLGMFVGGLLSRTTGLPAFKEGEWEPSLIMSLVLEAGFVAVWWRQRRRLRRY